MDALDPKAILLYGSKLRDEAKLDDYNQNIPVILCKNKTLERLSKIKVLKRNQLDKH